MNRLSTVVRVYYNHQAARNRMTHVDNCLAHHFGTVDDDKTAADAVVALGID